MCPHAHYERGTKLTFGRGPKGLGSSRVVFNALSCYLSLISILITIGYTKKNIVVPILGGGGAPVAPPLDPPLILIRFVLFCKCLYSI